MREGNTRGSVAYQIMPGLEINPTLSVKSIVARVHGAPVLSAKPAHSEIFQALHESLSETKKVANLLRWDVRICVNVWVMNLVTEDDFLVKSTPNISV